MIPRDRGIHRGYWGSGLGGGAGGGRWRGPGAWPWDVEIKPSQKKEKNNIINMMTYKR